MGMRSKSSQGLSLYFVSLTVGQEYTKHRARARLSSRNLQPNTGKLGARTSPRRKGSVSATGRKKRAINTAAEGKRLVEDSENTPGSDLTRGDRMEKRQSAEQQEEAGTDSGKENELEFNF